MIGGSLISLVAYAEKRLKSGCSIHLGNFIHISKVISFDSIKGLFEIAFSIFCLDGASACTLRNEANLTSYPTFRVTPLYVDLCRPGKLVFYTSHEYIVPNFYQP